MSKFTDLQGGSVFGILTDRLPRNKVTELETNDQVLLLAATWLLDDGYLGDMHVLKGDAIAAVRGALGSEMIDDDAASIILDEMRGLGLLVDAEGGGVRLTPNTDILGLVSAVKLFRAAKAQDSPLRFVTVLGVDDLADFLGQRSEPDDETRGALEALEHDHEINVILRGLLRRYGLSTVLALSVKTEDLLG